MSATRPEEARHAAHRDRLRDTLAQLLDALERASLRYAVLRNYEELPDVGNDLDLVVEPGAHDRVRDVLAGVADRSGWDVLAEVRSFRSAEPTQDILVFRFYRYDAASALQVDCFGGIGGLAVPYWDAAELLAARVRRGSFHTIGPHEHANRALQIAAECFGEETERVQRYAARLRDLTQGQREAATRVLGDVLGRGAIRGFEKLLEGATPLGASLIRRAKWAHFWRALARRPGRVTRRVVRRSVDRTRQFLWMSPGLRVYVQRTDAAGRARWLEEALQALVRGQVFRNYRMRAVASGWVPSLQDIRFCERFGVLVEVGDGEPRRLRGYDSVYREGELRALGVAGVSRRLLEDLLRKQRILWARSPR